MMHGVAMAIAFGGLGIVGLFFIVLIAMVEAARDNRELRNANRLRRREAREAERALPRDELFELVGDLNREAERLAFQLRRRHPSRQEECVICKDAPKTMLFRPCKHLCTCQDCAKLVETCPICRWQIEERERVYQ